MSRCERFREAIPSWAVGELDGDAATAVERHLGSCRECAELARAARTVAETVGPLGRLEPPRAAVERVAGDPCGRWRVQLFSALDAPGPDLEVGRLVEHLDGCAACAAVWEGLVAAREVGRSLHPSGAAVRRAAALPRLATARRVPGLRTVSAAAYALALATALLLGNPVTLARQGAEMAASRLGRAVQERVSATADEGRDEVRVLVWRLWRMAGRTAAALADIFDEAPRPSAAPEPEGGTR